MANPPKLANSLLFSILRYRQPSVDSDWNSAERGVMERLLIAEDDRTVQKALLRLFEPDRFSVEVASDGKSAMDAFHAAIPAAVVLDLGLPIMSGQEVCREIRRESLTVPIIILSALSDVRHRVLLLEMGADSYVTEPFSPRELLARVRALIRTTTESKRGAVEHLTAFALISTRWKRR
jgi:DNA-binding response OmpR family regulator